MVVSERSLSEHIVVETFVGCSDQHSRQDFKWRIDHAITDINAIEIGMRFQADTEQGPLPVVVTGVGDGMVTIDGNHSLAGWQLYFDVSITDLCEASDEEIEHGHVHNPHEHEY